MQLSLAARLSPEAADRATLPCGYDMGRLHVPHILGCVWTCVVGYANMLMAGQAAPGPV